MIKEFDKGRRFQLSPHFFSYEFDCPCSFEICDHTLIDVALLQGLENLRDLVGPITILSGFRCTAHNFDVDGRPGSYHMLGKAADITAKGVKPSEVAAQAQTITLFKNGGIGRYATFTHVDVRGYTARWDMRINEVKIT